MNSDSIRQTTEVGVMFYLKCISSSPIGGLQPFKEVLEPIDEDIVWNTGRLETVSAKDGVKGAEIAVFVPVDKAMTKIEINLADLGVRIIDELSHSSNSFLGLQVTEIEAIEYTLTRRAGKSHSVAKRKIS